MKRGDHELVARSVGEPMDAGANDEVEQVVDYWMSHPDAVLRVPHLLQPVGANEEKDGPPDLNRSRRDGRGAVDVVAVDELVGSHQRLLETSFLGVHLHQLIPCYRAVGHGSGRSQRSLGFREVLQPAGYGTPVHPFVERDLLILDVLLCHAFGIHVGKFLFLGEPRVVGLEVFVDRMEDCVKPGTADSLPRALTSCCALQLLPLHLVAFGTRGAIDGQRGCSLLSCCGGSNLLACLPDNLVTTF
mmetsp:Transcript_41472/g.130653  ORF Transcript_41472/g.130653 Transcript_41472/m.130653 type:complete len:245 (+) Transcript_41472:894-1628(+)